ncbi:trigger factor [Chlamydia sp. 17-3921]|uniref:trigger factor n=1 Tax=Chlamydia sp. 17-3921 TaxID=2675798 RepID=UPI0019187D96|nr:trigger factor [Chlamydia sp. 17-3921]
MSRSFSNEQFSIDLEEHPNCLVSALVKTSPELLNSFHRQAIKKVKKNITLPGFRKGKAPDDTIVTRYPDAIRKECNELLIQAAYSALSSVGDRRPLSPQAVQSTAIQACDLSEGGQVSFTYEAFPIIPEISWEKLTLPEASQLEEVSEEDIAKSLNNIAYFFATKTPVTRPSQEGDFLSISLHVSKQNEETVLSPIFENKYFKLSDEDMTDAFKEKFLGASVGHRIIEHISSPEIQKFLNGDTLIFTVNAVMEIFVPELDEEKVQQLQVASLDELKTKLRARLENQAKEKLQQQRFSEAEEALASLVDFELPATLLKERISILTREKLLNARLIQYCSNEELESRKPELLKEAEDSAVKALRLSFLTRKIFVEEQLSFNREELQYTIEACSRERFGSQPPKNISNEVLQELISASRDRLTYSKAIEKVLEKAEILTASTPT